MLLIFNSFQFHKVSYIYTVYIYTVYIYIFISYLQDCDFSPSPGTIRTEKDVQDPPTKWSANFLVLKKETHHLWFNQCVWSSFYLRLGNSPYYAPFFEFHPLLLGILWLGVEKYSKVGSNLWIIWGYSEFPNLRTPPYSHDPHDLP